MSGFSGSGRGSAGSGRVGGRNSNSSDSGRSGDRNLGRGDSGRGGVDRGFGRGDSGRGGGRGFGGSDSGRGGDRGFGGGYSGRGGVDRGFGRGGSGRGGGRGGNSHMGNKDEVRDKLTLANDKKVILAVLNSSENGRLGSASNFTCELPAIGAELGPCVIANHHMVNFNIETVFQYDVKIFPMRGSNLSDIDICKIADSAECGGIFREFCRNHGSQGAVWTYDGRSIAYTLQKLWGSLVQQIVVCDWKRFTVQVTFARELTGEEKLPALETSLFERFRRALVANGNVKHIPLGNNKLFLASTAFNLNGSFLKGFEGFFASMKLTKSGLTVICDTAVSCFLGGGCLIDLLKEIFNARNAQEFPRPWSPGAQNWERAKVVYKASCIVRYTTPAGQVQYSKKIKEFCSPADSRESAFEYEGRLVTVAEYFKRRYNITLKYPGLPTVNCGTTTKKVLFPAEFVFVKEGQCRIGEVKGNMTASMITHAAILPNERFSRIQEGIELINSGNEGFLSGMIDTNPVVCSARLLPPAELQYKKSKVTVGLSGDWKTPENDTFFSSAPKFKYFLGYFSEDNADLNLEANFPEFIQNLEPRAKRRGLIMEKAVSDIRLISNLESAVSRLVKIGVTLLIVIMDGPVYERIKCIADRQGLLTQCVKSTTAAKSSGIVTIVDNILLKINTKMSGVNHALASHGTCTRQTFQNPACSLPAFCNVPFMVVGVDVSHPDKSQGAAPSMAAVVGSLDGSCSQYACEFRSQESHKEEVSCLEECMTGLLRTFKKKNQVYPKNIIVFRDGVSEGQFPMVRNNELRFIKEALLGLGVIDARVTLIVCQKGHHTRFCSNDRVNLCPGVLIDQSCVNSVCSESNSEFFLNSHVAIKGTAKACKYSVLENEIGMSLAQVQLMAYWLCYLYCRCNKSVSYPTPAYYAHWASKRARAICAGGGDERDLEEICAKYLSGKTMFFV